MRSKNERRDETEFSILTPWEVEVDDAPFTRYCSNLLQTNLFSTTSKIQKNLPTLNQKKRAVSHCNSQKNENIPPTADKTKYNKSSHENMGETIQNRAFATLTQNRAERTEKKREVTERGVLQEISVKNFVIEGEQKSSVKEKGGKKKESSYILKQKFNEFRRSMKSIQQYKENCNLKVIRYD
jgi:hypothetical protein